MRWGPAARRQSAFWRGRVREAAIVIPASFVFPLLREHDVVADIAWWIYLVAVWGAYLAFSVVAYLVPPDAPDRIVWVRPAVVVAGTTVCMYVTGLGPVLAVAYAAVAADQVRQTGARAARPVAAWSVAGLAVGEVFVATDVAPSVVTTAQSHGLAALGGFAVAATVLVFANVAGARERSEATSEHLLALAGDLARTTSVREVCELVARSVPRTAGLDRAAVLLWDPDEERLTAAAVHGYPEPLATDFIGLTVGPDEAPTLLDLVREPRVLRLTAETEDPFVRAGFEHFGATEAFVAPVVTTAGQVLGVIVADRTTGAATGLRGDLEGRLAGLGSQTSIALENVRLLDRERAIADQLRESDRMKSEFLAVVSHELRTPISVMMGAARTLQLRERDLDPSMRQELIESVVRRGDQLNRLVEDLLQASGQVKLDIAPVDVSALARTAVTDAQSIYPGRVIRWAGAEEPVVARADSGRVRQVLDNLVENAVKYAPDSPITVSVERAGGDALLRVTDEGAGMTRDHVHQAFDAFFQVDSSAVRNVGGLGLGLHICRRIVDAHGGRIWIDSTPGAGTRVNVRLPG